MGAEERSTGLAPALADALVVAAAAWSRLRSGQSLDRALELAMLDLAPPGQRGDGRLSGAVRDITASAVRRCAVLEYLLGELVHRPPDPAVTALLAVSLAQLLAGSYTEFTLVDQAVRAARSRAQTAGAAAMVNAVLREFLRRRAMLEEQARSDPARRFNVPPWWLERLQHEYGSRAESVLAAQLEEPPLILRVNCRRATVAQQLAELRAAGLDASQVGPSALWLHRATAVERIPGFTAGLVSVQDAGAQLAAPWLGVGTGMRVLDACAAPGGKTAHLLEIADCRVDAVEMDPKRAIFIESNLRRLGLAGDRARVLVGDILGPRGYWNGVQYDRILLDAPCSASGVVRRHPDVPWLRRPSDVANLATRQAKMLHTLWPLLAPAGRLLYVVCSVFAEEGRRQIAAFVRRQPGVRRLRLPHGGPTGLQLLPNSAVNVATEPGDVAVPVLHDGFFYALLEKI
ncbi:Ribosomal RNA small subunit methyltransferase B [Burkholderiales bacterium]|nr:Ribosomal RNA small subunit methyltransferase B [Burkholderiales bacterium]